MQQSVAYLAAFAALGMASPVEKRANIKFTVPQVSTGNTKVAAPPVAMLKAISKYNGTAPTVVSNAAAAASQSGTVTASSYDVCTFRLIWGEHQTDLVFLLGRF